MGAYFGELLVLWAIFAIAATVVAALAEDAGVIHAGAAAFMGVGAYTAALLVTRLELHPQLALLATVPVGACAGVLMHYVVARLRADVLALATLAAGIILHGIMLNATSLTGGAMGLAAIPRRPAFLGNSAVDALILLAGVIALFALVRRTRFGKRVCALREDEGLANDLELHPSHVRAVLWISSSAILAAAGGVLAFQLRYVDPSSFTVRESVGILAMAFVFPRKHLSATLGALVFIAFPEVLRFLGLPPAIGPQIRQLVFGVALLIVVSRATRQRAVRPEVAHA